MQVQMLTDICEALQSKKEAVEAERHKADNMQGKLCDKLDILR